MRDTANLTARAFELVDAAQGDPAAVAAEASAIVREAPGTKAAVVALWALGLTERERGQLQKSREHLESGVQLSEHVGDAETTARVRDSLAFTLFLLGDDQGALRQTELAAPHLRGGPAARLRMQQALILQRLGDTEAALRAYRRALTGMVRAGDRLGEARLRINRSMLHTYRWDLGAAQADLERAHALSAELGHTLLMAGCEHNLGFIEGRRGNVPEAMEWYARARETYRAAGVGSGNAAMLEVDQAQLLLEVGLSEEAYATAQRATELLRESEADRAEAMLLAARAALAAERLDAAGTLAVEASDAFRRQHRAAWRALADYVGLQARLADLLRTPDVDPADALALARSAGRSRRQLERHGWVVEALHAAVIQARGLLAAGRVADAKRQLETAQQGRTRGPVELRLQAWHATALLRTIEGNTSGARRALAAGLRLLDEHRATLGAAEFRAATARHADELVDLGISLALGSDRPERLLAWSDRSRAGAVRLHPAKPPRDSRIAADLTQLRRLEQDANAAALAGRNPERILRERAAMERRIRDHARRHRGQAAPGHAIDLAGLRDRLGHRALVEFVEHRGALHAVVVQKGRVVRHDLGSSGALTDLIDRSRADLSRLAHETGSAAGLEAAELSLADVGVALHHILMAPLDVGDRTLVIVPAGTLHGLPWRVLPALAERPFSVAPSAHAWLRASRRRPGRAQQDIVVAAGPGLAHGYEEARAVARLYPSATRLTGRNATVGRVLEALQQARQAHLVAHGHFRADNPMFSSIEMADGPLTVFDMERLPRVPTTITLPACDAAVTGVRPGNEVLGLAAALLAVGVRSLTVPQVPIPDDETPVLMRAYHRRLLAGDPPPTALAAAVGPALDSSKPSLRAAARAFVVMGA